MKKCYTIDKKETIVEKGFGEGGNTYSIVLYVIGLYLIVGYSFFSHTPFWLLGDTRLPWQIIGMILISFTLIFNSLAARHHKED